MASLITRNLVKNCFQGNFKISQGYQFNNKIFFRTKFNFSFPRFKLNPWSKKNVGLETTEKMLIHEIEQDKKCSENNLKQLYTNKDVEFPLTENLLIDLTEKHKKCTEDNLKQLAVLEDFQKQIFVYYAQYRIIQVQKDVWPKDVIMPTCIKNVWQEILQSKRKEFLECEMIDELRFIVRKSEVEIEILIHAITLICNDFQSNCTKVPTLRINNDLILDVLRAKGFTDYLIVISKENDLNLYVTCINKILYFNRTVTFMPIIIKNTVSGEYNF